MWETSSLTARIGGSHVFIFQAEDGIRDLYVTGVQTCALPICRPRPPPEETPASSESSPPCARGASPRSGARCDRGTRACRRLDRWRAPTRSRRRSEERRVGKECSSRVAAHVGNQLIDGKDRREPCFYFSSRRRHTRSLRDWSSDVCSSDLPSAPSSGRNPSE